MGSNGKIPSSIPGLYSTALEINDERCAICYVELRQEPVVQTNCGHRFCTNCLMRMNDPRCPIDNVPLTRTEQAISHDQHGDAGLSTEESHDTAQTEQLGIPIQEQHSDFQLGFCVGASGISNHVEEGAARSRYLCGYQQLPYQSEDDNQASGWSPRSARILQGGSQTIRTQGRFNAPVQDSGNGLQNRVTSTQEQITENCCGTQELQQLWNETETLRRLYLFDEAMSQIEARICRGTYQWKIKQFQQRRQDAITGTMVALFSPAIYTSFDGYTFRIRMHLNGLNRGMGTHVAIFVHMMQGDCDNMLAWPFTGVITLSVLDQSDAKDPKDVTQVVVASPKLLAFRKPTASCSQIGCGFELFAPIDQICAEPFIQNNTMLVRVQISPLP